MGKGSPLQVRLFGRFRVERGGKVVRLPTRETRLLLAYLVLHPGDHPREALAARFWPKVPDHAARASLRNALSTLRRQLGRELLEADRETVRLNPAYRICVDAVDFRAEAMRFLDGPTPDADAVNLDLYTDDLLVDCYEDWVLVEREALLALYLKTLLAITQQLRAHSDYARAIAFAEKVLARDRANERAHQHLMFCHVAVGDRGAALRQYQACRNALADELAVEPSAATEKLHEWIRQAPLERLPVEASLTNLPIPVTPFIGRQRESAAVKERLSSARLVTLTGAGGSGKTRLAIQVATDLLEDCHDGVWWVELAGVSDGEALPDAVAKALGVPEVPGQTTGDTLANFLRSRRLLLVLDNCEHLVEACAALVTRLLGECPALKALVTSRERLRVAGEHVQPIPPLAVPDTAESASADSLRSCESVQLFVGRAAAACPDFRLRDDNAAAVAAICRRLDGLPLAIELAAARVNALAPGQIVERLDDAFDLLGGGRGNLPHHRTLRAAIDWSFALLSAPERVLLRRLSVFAGGWTLPAAEAVCAGGELARPEIADRLSQLVDKSLVTVEAGEEARRYRMLETICEYAREGLVESGEAEALAGRHLRYCQRFVASADPHLGFMLPDAELDEWLGRLEPEQDNLRAAVRWSLRADPVIQSERNALTEAGLRLLIPQHAFWFSRGRFAEGRAWLEALLAKAAEVPAAVRARALVTAGFIACWQGDFADGRAPLKEAQALFRDLDDASGEAFATHGLGFVTLGEGDADAARSLFETALDIAREADDPWIMSFALHFSGIVLTFQGDFDRAASRFEAGDALIRAQGGHRQALGFSQFHLGRISRLRGDLSNAGARLVEAMRLFRAVGDRRGIGYALSGFALLAASRGDPERAVRLAGAVASLVAVLGHFLEAPLQAEFDRELDAVQEALGQAAFAKAETEGRTLRLEAAIAYALEAPA